jgi:hypothetical protein
MILWPLLYLACQANFERDFDVLPEKLHDYAGRLFPFHVVWRNNQENPMPYDRGVLVALIKDALLDKFSSPHCDIFERICHICGFMCAHDPKDRKMVPQSPLTATEQCLHYLVTGSAVAAAAIPPNAPQTPPEHNLDLAPPSMHETFDPVCKFIDNFCASGHVRGTATVLAKTHHWQQLKFSSKAATVDYDRMSPEQSWLFANRNPDPRPLTSALTFKDCLTPDYCVLPSQQLVHGPACPRLIFLPRDKFCSGAGSDAGMFDVAQLTLLTQTDWFTVFRYERLGHSPWIIKSDKFAFV